MPKKFQSFGGISFGGFLLLMISKWQPKYVRECRRGTFGFRFLNSAAKTCSYGLKNLKEN